MCRLIRPRFLVIATVGDRPGQGWAVGPTDPLIAIVDVRMPPTPTLVGVRAVRELRAILLSQ